MDRRAAKGREQRVVPIASRPLCYPPAMDPGDPASGTADVARPLGVYVHFPFCSVRCPYCDFAVDTRAAIPHERYADAVLAELAHRQGWFLDGARSPALRSVYFGGGTPGLWRPDQLARVLDGARAAFGSTPAEVTVEANPGEVTVEHLRALRQAGVDRLSLGVQSFDDGLLVRIGRNHDGRAPAGAVSAARAAGFERLSCDLMYGLPGQSLEDWKRAVEAVLALAPDHVSAYALTIERGTPFGALDRAGRLPRPEDELVSEMFVWGRQALAAAGFEHYEVSSYARPGQRAVHNGLYWSGGAYLGLGASAASFRPLTDGRAWRFTNARATDSYLARAARAPAQVELRLSPDLENEALWLGLRTRDGVDRVAHAQRHGADPLAAGQRAAAARRCVDAGWLEITAERLRLTDGGFLFADEVASRLWL
jgi:oxygen-independent coproporphyrinogen-3 oxidase